MKKYILFPVVLVALVLSSNMVKAQAEDVANPLLQYINKDKGIRFTAGARLFADVAYYHSEYTPMKSGAALTDARIRTSLTYGPLYFYADFDFSKGTFKQKNIFVRYNFHESVYGIHSVKAGYFNEPSSMSLNASLYNYHLFPVRLRPWLYRPGVVWGLPTSIMMPLSSLIKGFSLRTSTMTRFPVFKE